MGQLTEKDARTMEAGRGLDRLIAQKLMGWKTEVDPDADQYGGPATFWRRPDGETELFHPYYSTKWSSAGPLLKKIVTHDEVFVYSDTGRIGIVPRGHGGGSVPIFDGPLEPETIAVIAAIIVARDMTQEQA